MGQGVSILLLLSAATVEWQNYCNEGRVEQQDNVTTIGAGCILRGSGSPEIISEPAASGVEVTDATGLSPVTRLAC